MALFVGLDVSLKMTSICVVEADGSPVWEGKAESEPAPLVKALSRWRDKITLVGTKLVRYPNGCTARWSKVGFRWCASRPVTRSGSFHRARTRPTAAMHAGSPT